MSRSTATPDPDVGSRLLTGVLVGFLCAVPLAMLLAVVLPGSAVDRSVIAGVLFPVLWLAVVLRILVNRNGLRVALELIGLVLVTAILVLPRLV